MVHSQAGPSSTCTFLPTFGANTTFCTHNYLDLTFTLITSPCRIKVEVVSR